MAQRLIACFDITRHPHVTIYIPEGPDNPGSLAIKLDHKLDITIRMTRSQTALLIALLDAALDDLKLGLAPQVAGWRQLGTVAKALADDEQPIKPSSVRTKLDRAESWVRANLPSGCPVVRLFQRRNGQGVRLFPSYWELASS